VGFFETGSKSPAIKLGHVKVSSIVVTPDSLYWNLLLLVPDQSLPHMSGQLQT